MFVKNDVIASAIGRRAQPLSLNAVQLSHIAATHRLEIRGNGGCAKIEVHSD